MPPAWGCRFTFIRICCRASASGTGKGEALWKSLLVTRGDILAWIDTDIVNIHPRFVYGILGPLLHDPRVQFVKGFYRRPLKVGRQRCRRAAEGGSPN